MQLKFSRKQKGPPIVAKVIQVSAPCPALPCPVPRAAARHDRRLMPPLSQPTPMSMPRPQNAANLANIRYNLNPEDLVVAEAFVNRAHIQKGVMIHGRGAWGLGLGFRLGGSGRRKETIPASDRSTTHFNHNHVLQGASA